MPSATPYRNALQTIVQDDGTVTTAPPNYQQPYTGPGGFNPADPYDPRIGNGGLPAGVTGAANRAYTRETQANELSGNQLMDMLRQDGRYIQDARARGVEYAAERGSFLGSAAAGSAERAAIEAASPFALQQAGAYQSAAQENLGYLNERALADGQFNATAAMGRAATIAAEIEANNRLQLQRESLAFSGEMQGLDREQQVRVQSLDQGFQHARDFTNFQYDTGRQDNQTRNNIREYATSTGIDLRSQRISFLNNLFQTAMSDPELYPPEFIGGFFQTWNDVFTELESPISQWLDQLGGF